MKNSQQQGHDVFSPAQWKPSLSSAVVCATATWLCETSHQLRPKKLYQGVAR